MRVFRWANDMGKYCREEIRKKLPAGAGAKHNQVAASLKSDLLLLFLRYSQWSHGLIPF